MENQTLYNRFQSQISITILVWIAKIIQTHNQNIQQ